VIKGGLEELVFMSHMQEDSSLAERKGHSTFDDSKLERKEGNESVGSRLNKIYCRSLLPTPERVSTW
jgi:hypothetical protein